MVGLSVSAHREDEIGFLELRGEARLEDIPHLQGAARGLIAGGARTLLVGAGGVEFADSASIGTLLDLEKECRVRGGSLVLYDLKPRLRRLVADTGLADSFRIAADEAAARVAAGQALRPR
jgi:anti-anti-sigma factor